MQKSLVMTAGWVQFSICDRQRGQGIEMVQSAQAPAQPGTMFSPPHFPLGHKS